MVKDHLGNEYNNIIEMCKHYGISYSNYKNRIQLGWSQEKALTYKVKHKEKKVKDYLDNSYNSINEMLQHYGIDRHIYMSRIRRGYTQKEALVLIDEYKPIIKDHNRIVYKTISDMCKTYGIVTHNYYERIASGWELEREHYVSQYIMLTTEI